MKRVTLRDIASRAKVSIMTVSFALRDSPEVSPETRNHIKQLAREMGYRPDPALSSLMEYRRGRTQRSDVGTVAFLTSFATSDGWKSKVFTQQYFDGASLCAKSLGYHLEPFWLREPGMTPRRMAQILESRGIRGLLIAPIIAPEGIVQLDWDRFCAVSLCTNLISPYINVVDSNHFQTMSLAHSYAKARRYQKIGYVVHSVSESMTGKLWLATYLVNRAHIQSSNETDPQPLLFDQWSRDTFEEWLLKNKPDIVISPQIAIYEWMIELGCKIPQEVGFLWLEAEPDRQISGVCQQFSNIGTIGMELLHHELMRNAFGIPRIRQSVQLDGHWLEGKTIRPPETV